MAKQLKIGFIQANNEIDVQWFRPLSFGYLKAYIDKYIKDNVEMNFINAKDNFNKYDIIGISSTSQDFGIAKKIATTIKESNRDIITIIGGHHISCLPETLSKEFDIGVIGEGEETFKELIKYFIVNGPFVNNETLKSIHGIALRENGHVVLTPKRELILPLDNIPFPYRSKDSAQYLLSSRGCPYKCAFCSSSAFWGKTRFFSAEYVMGEIEHLLEQSPNTSHITIWDDLFIANKSRFKKFVELVVRNKINNKTSFTFSVRANLVDDELCDDLKRINVISTSFGAESGADRILNILNKGTTVEINQRAIDTFHKHKIKVTCSFIVGTPSETANEARSTYEFILKNIIDKKLTTQSVVNILMPIPGTEMWDYCIRSNIIDINNFNWKRLSVFASYKHSQRQKFDDWLDYRRKNNSVYLAEDSLSQEKLYELMSIYENTIIALERCAQLEEIQKNLNGTVTSKTSNLTTIFIRFFNLLKGN